MQALGRRDFRAVLDFLAMLGETSDLDDFAARLAFGLEQVIPCRGASYNEVNLARQRVRWVTGIPTSPDDIAAFERHMPVNPIISYMSENPDSDAIVNTDLLSEPRWRDLGVYHDLYHPLRLEHILAVTASKLPLMIGIALFREQTPFSERDRALLTLLRPHIANSYRNVALLADLGERAALLDRGMEIGGLGAIVLGADDRIRSMTESARAWLVAYFDHPANAPGLPMTVQAWLRRLSLPASAAETLSQADATLARDRGGNRLTLRLVHHGGQRLMLMQERRATPRVEQLAALGLARREAEILAWVTAGKTDAEIGEILGISPRTVNHTLERVYRKLGVETRTAAAMRALASPTTPP
jgi:DNA-binding CsgD family transcriptional regulator